MAHNYLRATVLFACGVFFGVLFNSFIKWNHGSLKVEENIPSLDRFLKSPVKPEENVTSTSLPNTIEIQFSDFVKTKEQVSQLNVTFKFARDYADDRDKITEVPKFLHFLWIFQPITEKYLDAISGFEKNNPNFEIFFWSDNASLPKVQNRSSWNIRHVDSLELTIPEVIESESEDTSGWGWIGAKSDLLSYEIIYQFGGIYLDLDSQSLKPFGSYFLNSFVCYDVGWNTLVHSVFGMPPGSKFLQFALESARFNYKDEEFRRRIVYLRYGPSFLGKMFFEFNDDRINIIDSGYLIWNHTNTNYMIQTNDQSWGGRRL